MLKTFSLHASLSKYLISLTLFFLVKRLFLCSSIQMNTSTFVLFVSVTIPSFREWVNFAWKMCDLRVQFIIQLSHLSSLKYYKNRQMYMVTDFKYTNYNYVEVKHKSRERWTLSLQHQQLRRKTDMGVWH